jgi:hypothetical protein
MELSHRCTDTGSTTQRLVALFLLLLGIFSSDTLAAQNPAYSFASGIGGTGTERNFASAFDASDNIYVTGSFQGTVDFDPGTGTASLTAASTNGDIYVASYDASGSYRWAFRIGASGGENWGRAIAVDGSGNVVVTGFFYGTTDFNPGTGSANLTGPSSFVARYTSSGSYLWAFPVSIVGSVLPVAIDGSGNIVLTGSFTGTVDFNPGSGKASLTSVKESQRVYSHDVFVAKYSSSGSYLWAFRVGSVGGEYASSVDVDGSGNIYITGGFDGTVDFNPATATANQTSAGGQDIFVAKYSGAGVYVWANRAGGSSNTGTGTNYADVGTRIAVDGSGNAVVAGEFYGTVDFDPGTGTASLTSVGTGTNCFVARYNSTGGYLWAFTPLARGSVQVTIDGSGDIYLTGGLAAIGSDTVGFPNDFDPGTATVSFAGRVAYLARYTSSGAYLWAFAITSDSLAVAFASGQDIAVNGSGDIFVTGEFTRTYDFDPSEAAATLTSASAGIRDIFIAKYTQPALPKRSWEQGTGISDNDLTMQVMPNPFTSTFTFRYAGGSTSARIEVVDMMGQVVETRDMNGAGEMMLGEGLPTGTYIVRIMQGELTRQMLVRKLR